MYLSSSFSPPDPRPLPFRVPSEVEGWRAGPPPVSRLAGGQVLKLRAVCYAGALDELAGEEVVTKLGEKIWRGMLAGAWIAALCLCVAPPHAGAQAGATQTAPQKEKSVKPGINEQWKSPNIDPLIGTLEAESREIYREREKIAALVAPKKGSVVADIGAGSGFLSELFARMVGPQGEVFAVDINPKLLEHIEQNARTRGLTNLQIVLGREDSVDLPADSVDLMFICDTYHHFEYPKSSLRSIYRALRPGGEIVVVDFRRVPGKSPSWTLEHVRAGQDIFSKEITDAGFELVREEAAPFLTENYVLRFRKPVVVKESLLVPSSIMQPATF